MIRQLQSVALVDLGENLSFDPQKLASKLNSMQKTWRFQVVGSKANLGEPDVDSIWFYIDRLLSQLETHKPAAKFDMVIGLTHVRLENRDPVLGEPDRDYFSLSDRQRLGIVTEAMRQWNSPNKNLYQYLAFLIVGELLQIAAGVPLFHQSKEQCLFDDCADRAELAPAIERGRICPQSRHDLFKAQVSDATINDAVRILNWCRRNSIAKSMELTFASPLVTLVIGTAVGWVTSSFLGPQWYKVVIVVTLVAFVVGFFRNRIAKR